MRSIDQKKALSPGNWQAMQNTPQWNSWLGYTFEAICYKHLPAIRRKLGIHPAAIADTWRFVPKKHTQERGAQIDLLFDRPDDAITLCEIKYIDSEITPQIIPEVEKKCALLKIPKGFTLEKALISRHGQSKTLEASGYFQHHLSVDDFF